MRGLISFVVILLMVFSFMDISAQDSTTRIENYSSVLSNINSPESTERTKAASQLIAFRQEITRQLILIVKSEQSGILLNSPKEFAIKLLGEYRAAEAVSILVENISFQTPGKTSELVPAAAYPSVAALAKIGIPSLEGIVGRLDKPMTEKELKLFATVFRLIDGDDLAIIRSELVLKKADGQKKKNLDQLVELLKAKQWYF